MLVGEEEAGFQELGAEAGVGVDGGLYIDGRVLHENGVAAGFVVSGATVGKDGFDGSA